jgi:hypothetical protein
LAQRIRPFLLPPFQIFVAGPQTEHVAVRFSMSMSERTWRSAPVFDFIEL